MGVVEVPGESGGEEGDRGAACGGDHRISGVVVTSFLRHARLRSGISLAPRSFRSRRFIWFFADNVAFRQEFLKFAMLSRREADILT